MIDAGSGPTPTPQRFPANEPNGIRKLPDKIAALELRIKESTSNLLGTAGIRLTQLGMFIDSSLTVGGSLDVTGPMVVGGTLSLPAGIIDNDALTSPVMADATADSVSGAATGTTSTVQTTLYFTVPAGFTQALVVSTSGVMGRNSTAITDYIYTQAVVNGVGGGELYTAVAAGLSGGVSAPYYRRISGLTGGQVIPVSVATRTGFAAWAASAANMAIIHAEMIYLR